ncbi:MAG: hypothetical protein ACYC63_04490 [Armatimonadota bacterium]
MPIRHALLCLTLLLCLLLTSCAHARVLVEWDLTHAAGGWKDEAGSTPQFGTDGALWPGSEAGVSLRSPSLSLPTDAFQTIELSISFEKAGSAHLLWQGEAFGRSQSGWHGPLPVEAPADGEVHELRLLPLWQNVKRIEGLRIVAPPGTRMRLRSLLIITPDVPAGDHTSWDFTSSTQAGQWQPVASAATLAASPQGLQVRLNQPSSLIVSPPLDLPTFQYEWLSLRLSSPRPLKAKLQWACSATRGLHGPELQLRPGTHTYNVRCGVEKSWAGQLRGLAVEVLGGPGDQLTLQALTLSNEPQGAADLTTAYAGPLEPVIRPNRTFRLCWTLVNEGGQEARDVKVTAIPGEGVILPGGSLAASRLDHGVPETLTWLVKTPAPATVTLRAEYARKVLEETVKLPVAEAAELPPPGALPRPVPAAVEGVNLAAHYHAPPPPAYGPQALDRMLYQRPYLGDYAATPEVLDWQIKWSLEHGINTWIFDIGSGDEAATLDAFLGARFARQMQFCLRWTTPVPTVDAAEALLGETLAAVLAHPNYLRVEGKPVVLVANALRRTTEGWGLSDLKALPARLPLTLLACLPLDAANADLLQKAGYAAAIDLHTEGTFPRAATPLQDWQQAADAGTPHALSLQPAWREGMTPEKLQTLLRVALLRARKTDPCALPLIVAGDFNSENSLEPRRPEGFRWLTAIAAAVGAPAAAQLVPEDVALGPYDRTNPAPVSHWEFDSKDGWTSAMGMSVLRVAAGELTGRTDSTEPAIFGGETKLDTRLAKAIVIGMSASAGTHGRLWWRTSLRKFSRDNSLPFELIADGAIHEYRLEVEQLPGWRGYLEGLRIDPTNDAGAAIALDYVRVVQ